MFKKIKIYKNEILEENGKIRHFNVIFPNLVIEDDVEIFSGSVIGRLPKGAIIEDDVSIGAGSIVNKNVFPSNFMLVFPQNI
jgi:UDP-3-O-[3-hydroxymyristoyl] glucosamine N-acyltransferase